MTALPTYPTDAHETYPTDIKIGDQLVDGGFVTALALAGEVDGEPAVNVAVDGGDWTYRVKISDLVAVLRPTAAPRTADPDRQRALRARIDDRARELETATRDNLAGYEPARDVVDDQGDQLVELERSGDYVRVVERAVIRHHTIGAAGGLAWHEPADVIDASTPDGRALEYTRPRHEPAFISGRPTYHLLPLDEQRPPSLVRALCGITRQRATWRLRDDVDAAAWPENLCQRCDAEAGV